MVLRVKRHVFGRSRRNRAIVSGHDRRSWRERSTSISISNELFAGEPSARSGRSAELFLVYIAQQPLFEISVAELP